MRGSPAVISSARRRTSAGVIAAGVIAPGLPA